MSVVEQIFEAASYATWWDPPVVADIGEPRSSHPMSPVSSCQRPHCHSTFRA